MSAIGSEPIPVEGKGIVRMCVSQYKDNNGLDHPIDPEIEDVHWVPWSPIDVLATPSLSEQNMYLFVGPRGNESTMPGFTDQALCEYEKFVQTEDSSGDPVLVLKLGMLHL